MKLENTGTVRQIGLVIGLIASVVIGAAVVLWLWVPGSNDYFNSDNSNYSAVDFQNDFSKATVRSGFSDNNNRFSESGSENHRRALNNTGSQLEYTRKLEEIYTQRIERLLEPLLGNGSVRAQVTAAIDFSSREQTLEKYDADNFSLRKKEIEENIKDTINNKSNDSHNPLKNYRREVNNYELDKTTSLIRSAIGKIEKLSITVIIDDKKSKGVKGNTIRTPHTDEELNNYNSLIKQAVGYNSKRGDIINVIGASFKTNRFNYSHSNNKSSITPTWNQVWAKDLFNKLLGTLIILLLIFSVIRPATKSLVNLAGNIPEENSRNQRNISNSKQSILIHEDYEKNMNIAAQAAERDPKLVAQVMKNWVSADGT